jgi:hypothetical protein
MTTKPAATTTEEALTSLQLQINKLNDTVAGIQKNILVLDGNLQKIYAAYNSHNRAAAAPTGTAQGMGAGGWL